MHSASSVDRFGALIPIRFEKHQIEMALSTLEAECIALPQGLRDLLPAKEFLEEIAGKIDHVPYDESKFNQFSFLDNMPV